MSGFSWLFKQVTFRGNFMRHTIANSNITVFFEGELIAAPSRSLNKVKIRVCKFEIFEITTTRFSD